MSKSNSYTEPSLWMHNDGNADIQKDDIVKTARGWEKMYPDGRSELLISMPLKGGVAPTVAAYITAVTNPANGTYGITDVLTWTLITDKAVNVDTGSGTPRLVIDVAGTPFYANYASGSGTTSLVFEYTIGNETGNDITVGPEVDLNGGEIEEANGLDFNNDLPSGYVQANIDIA